MKVRFWMAVLTLLAGVSLAEAGVPGAVPTGDGRWEVIPASAFGQNGLKIDRLTGEARYLEKVNKSGKWLSIPGPMSANQKKKMAYQVNYQVKATNANIYLIDLHKGEAWRLADRGGKPYWRKIQ